jgi:hypothetical protein
MVKRNVRVPELRGDVRLDHEPRTDANVGTLDTIRTNAQGQLIDRWQL